MPVEKWWAIWGLWKYATPFMVSLSSVRWENWSLERVKFSQALSVGLHPFVESTGYFWETEDAGRWVIY